LERKGIDHYYTAVNNPLSNGLNERLNQTLVNRIRCCIIEKNKTHAWARIAIECTEEYNSTIHSSTKFPPAYLMYGKIESISPLQTVSDYSCDLALAYRNSLISHEKNKKRFDGGRGEIILQIGEKVYIENGNRLNKCKLDEVRIGPFKVKNKLSNTVYEIKVAGDKARNTRLYHISKIIRCENE